MYRSVLVATDGSDHATEAARHAITIAKATNATLHAVYVIDTRTEYDNAILNPAELRDHLERIGEEALEAVGELAAEKSVTLTTTIEEGNPAVEIPAYVDNHDIDFVCLGEQGHSEFKTVLLGSTAEAVVRETDVPVTLV